MIYVTGDTHGSIDINKLSTVNFSEQKEMTKEDYLIICGDFGCIWDRSKKEKYWLDWLDKKTFTTLFVDGNHENFNILDSYGISEFKGGMVHHIKDSIYHLMRGQVFNINGMKIFTMGGGTSHDKMYRRENISWWAAEIPNSDEFKEAEHNLDKVGRNVDYIITHCAPDSIQNQISGSYEHDILTNFLESVSWTVQYKKWFFGHYHLNLNIDEKHILLYEHIIRIA